MLLFRRSRARVQRTPVQRDISNDVSSLQQLFLCTDDLGLDSSGVLSREGLTRRVLLSSIVSCVRTTLDLISNVLWSRQGQRLARFHLQHLFFQNVQFQLTLSKLTTHRADPVNTKIAPSQFSSRVLRIRVRKSFSTASARKCASPSWTWRSSAQFVFSIP